MSTQANSAAPEVPAIDLEFAPRTYFLPPEIAVTHLAHIAGQERREMARARINAGDDDLEPELLAELLDEETRAAFGRIHPTFMGGEYLPKLQDDEIEIARISLASTTADQISVRARRIDDRIEYRIVDEYELDYVCAPTTSPGPLTMRDLVAMIDGSCEGGGPVFCALAHNVEGGGGEDEMRRFVTVGSEFYPELGRYYRHRLDAYLDGFYRERRTSLAEDDDAD